MSDVFGVKEIEFRWLTRDGKMVRTEFRRKRISEDEAGFFTRHNGQQKGLVAEAAARRRRKRERKNRGQ